MCNILKNYFIYIYVSCQVLKTAVDKQIGVITPGLVTKQSVHM